MKLQVIFLAALVAATPAGAQSPGNVVRDFHNAIARADTVAVLEHLAPDVVIFESGGAEMSRDEFAAHHMAADMGYAAATTREIVEERIIDSGETAIIMTRSNTTGRYRDRDVNSAGAETIVLRREAGGWRIVHIHWSSRRARS